MKNTNEESEISLESVLVVAKRQKTLLIIFLVYLLLVGFGAAASPEIKPILQLLVLPIMVLIIIFTARLSFKVFGKVGATMATILSIIPLINLITILVVNSKASKLIKSKGFRVGLIGANTKEIANAI